MARLWTDFIEGTIDTTLNAGDTTISGAFLTNLPAVSSPDFLALVLDPEGVGNGPEIVYVTAHTAAATTATVSRAQEGTSDVQHLSGTKAIHAITKTSMEEMALATDVATVRGTLDAHTADTSNPHSVTAAQAGAAPSSHVGAGGTAHAAATTSTAGFMSAADKSKLDSAPVTGQDILDALAPVGGSGSGLDADRLDGQEASAFAALNHNHDATYLGISATAAAASKLATSRRIQLTGDASGEVWFDGSVNKTLDTTIPGLLVASGRWTSTTDITLGTAAWGTKLVSQTITVPTGRTLVVMAFGTMLVDNIDNNDVVLLRAVIDGTAGMTTKQENPGHVSHSHGHSGTHRHYTDGTGGTGYSTYTSPGSTDSATSIAGDMSASVSCHAYRSWNPGTSSITLELQAYASSASIMSATEYELTWLVFAM